MKRTILLLAITLLVLPFALAQEEPPSEMDQGPGKPGKSGRDKSPDAVVMQMQKNLDLTEEQVADVKQAMQESNEKGKSIRDDTALTKEQKKEALGALRGETRNKMDAILTPEQKEKRDARKGGKQKEKREKKGGKKKVPESDS